MEAANGGWNLALRRAASAAGQLMASNASRRLPSHSSVLARVNPRKAPKLPILHFSPLILHHHAHATRDTRQLLTAGPWTGTTRSNNPAGLQLLQFWSPLYPYHFRRSPDHSLASRRSATLDFFLLRAPRRPPSLSLLQQSLSSAQKLPGNCILLGIRFATLAQHASWGCKRYSHKNYGCKS